MGFLLFDLLKHLAKAKCQFLNESQKVSIPFFFFFYTIRLAKVKEPVTSECLAIDQQEERDTWFF